MLQYRMTISFSNELSYNSLHQLLTEMSKLTVVFYFIGIKINIRDVPRHRYKHRLISVSFSHIGIGFMIIIEPI